MSRLLTRLAFALFILSFAVTPAGALGVDPPLPDPAQEARAIALHKALRCLVCQNQSIHDSNAGLAIDLRQLVRERVAAGQSDDQVIDYVVGRYGDWVLLSPPLKGSTLILWASPGLLILIGGLGVFAYHRRNRRALAVAVPPPALSPQERQRVDNMLQGDAS